MSQSPMLAVGAILALAVVGGAFVSGQFGPQNEPAEASASSLLPRGSAGAATRPAAAPAARTATPTATEPERPAFDILRVDPTGQSVIAGRAAPGSEIAIFAGETEIARTRTGSDGSFSIVATAEYPGGELPFRIAATKDGSTVRSDAIAMAVPSTASGRTRVAAVAGQAASGATKSTDSRDVRAAGKAKASHALETARAEQVSLTSQSAPLPVTFETGTATLTADGRRAARQLADYLKSGAQPEIVLSGHADERGPDLCNLRLSQRRLDAIAAFLRSEGYAGKLQLVPKGKSEPYTGVDRARLSKVEQWSLDRRVELTVR